MGTEWGDDTDFEYDRADEKPARKKRAAIPLCEGCFANRADPPSKLCPGCQAYRDHQR